MSIAALDWAFKQPIEKSSLKFILVCLANYANSNGEAYPSVGRLVLDSGQNEKTVRANLRALCKLEYIHKSPLMAGRSCQIPVYILAPYLTPTENGGGAKVDPSQKRRLTPTKNGPRPLPKTGNRTFFEPKEEPKAVLQKRASEEPDPERAERLRKLAAFAAHPHRRHT